MTDRNDAVKYSGLDPGHVAYYYNYNRSRVIVCCACSVLCMLCVRACLLACRSGRAFVYACVWMRMRHV